MTFPARLVVASKNAHKLREIARICADWPVSWVTVRDGTVDWPDVEKLYDAVGLPPLAQATASRLAVPVFAGSKQVGRIMSQTAR